MTSRRRGPLDALGGVLALAVLFAACGDSAPQPAADTSPTRTYATRGVVRALPGSGSMGDEMLIAHEEIPDFVDIHGEAVGMTAMSMSFPVAAGVDLAGVEPGDTIDFDLVVDWDESPPARITAVRPAAP